MLQDGRQSLPQIRQKVFLFRNLRRDFDGVLGEGVSQPNEAFDCGGAKGFQFGGVQVVAEEQGLVLGALSDQPGQGFSLGAIQRTRDIRPPEPLPVIELKDRIGAEINRQPAISEKTGDDEFRFAGA